MRVWGAWGAVKSREMVKNDVEVAAHEVEPSLKPTDCLLGREIDVNA